MPPRTAPRSRTSLVVLTFLVAAGLAGCGAEPDRVIGVWSLPESDVLSAAAKRMGEEGAAARAAIAKHPDEGMRKVLRAADDAVGGSDADAKEREEKVAGLLRASTLTLEKGGEARLDIPPQPLLQGRWKNLGAGDYEIELKTPQGDTQRFKARLAGETLDLLHASTESSDPKLRGEGDIDPDNPLHRWRRLP